MLKALLIAMLEPTEKLRLYELAGDYTARLALLEEFKSYPWQAIWNYYCYQSGVPVGESWLKEVRNYEKEVLDNR